MPIVRGKRSSRKISVVLALSFFIAPVLWAKPWQNLAPGIEYTTLQPHFLTPWSLIHVFRIRLSPPTLSLLTAEDLQLPHASMRDFIKHSHAKLAINGGFFDAQFRPLGLRVRNGKVISPLKSISWWGIFYLRNHKAYITNIRQFRNSNDNMQSISFAIQSGPRLLINGRIPPLKPGRAERSALGITKNGEVIILVTNFYALSTIELAQLMRSPPLSCIDALNLDGGSSSQLQTHIPSFDLSVHGLSNVSDAILVMPSS